MHPTNLSNPLLASSPVQCPFVRQHGQLWTRVLLIVAVLLSSLPAMAADKGWSGQWDSRWRDGSARITMTQEGNLVTGVYSLYDGRVEGIADGRELLGRWWQDGQTGEFLAVRSTDGLSFTARLADGEWWTGVRVLDDDRALGFDIEQSSPADTLYYFMLIMNSTGFGSMERKSEASRLVDWAALDYRKISLLDYTELIYEVLDQLTFRALDLNSSLDQTSYQAVLKQAGSDKTFKLNFSKINDEWFIEPPPEDDLRAELASLINSRPTATNRKMANFASPRATLKTFMTHFDETNKSSLNQVVDGLDQSEMSELSKRYESNRIAGYLKRAMTRVGTPIWQEIPDDMQRPDPYVLFEHPMGSIVLAPTQTANGTIWQFTPESLRNIRTLYGIVDDLPLSSSAAGMSQATSAYFAVRDFFGRQPDLWTERLGPMELWQWLGLAVALLLSYAMGRVISVWISLPILKLFHSNLREHPFYKNSLIWSLRLLLIGVTLRLMDEPLGLPDLIETVVLTTSFSLIVIALTVMGLILINLMTAHISRVQALAGNNITLVSLMAGILRITVVIAGILVLADLLEVPYQGVLAGLGVGGLAVALAAQSTLQNFISGITLYFDKPIAIGDYCRFGSREGTVEFIGMRSTRIRTLDRTLVTVPNSEFSNMQLENYAKRDRMFLNTTLQVRYETTPDQLRYLLAEIRRLLIAHPKVAADPLRVRFTGFGEHSLNINIFAYVRTDNRSEYLAIQEDLLLRMMDVVEKAGAQFAFPSMVYYEAQDTPHDEAKVKAAEMAVSKWREQNNLPFPDFSWQEKSEVSSTLDYPPTGSAVTERITADSIVNPEKKAPDFPEPEDKGK